MFSLRLRVAALVVAFPLSSVAAQSGSRPTDPAILTAFGLRSATTQSLVVRPFGSGGGLEFDIVLGGRLETARMLSYDLRARTVELIVRDAAGREFVQPTPPCVTYRGQLVGRPASRVAAGFWDGGLRATIWPDVTAPTGYGVDPLRAADPNAAAPEHVVYETSELLPRGSCGVSGRVEPFASSASSVPSVGVDVFRTAQIAIECDQPFMAARNDDTIVAQNYVTSVMNSVDVIYAQGPEIQYEITQIFFDVGSDPYSGTDAGSLLGQFRSYWRGNRGGVTRDVAHLFSGRDFDSPVIGVAYGRAICGTNRNYSISEHLSRLPTSAGAAVVAHELGHNWDASHCSGGSCNIMCATLGGCSGSIQSFGTGTVNQIVSYKNTRSCLSTTPAPTLTSVTPDAVEVFDPPVVVLRGTELTSVQEVRLIGATLTYPEFQVVSDTEIRFTPPRPSAVGVNSVWVVGPGSSNVLSFRYDPVPAPVLVAQPWQTAGPSTPWTLDFAGTPGDSWFVFMSPNQNVTFPILGIDFLLNSYQLASGVLAANGVGSWSIALPENELVLVTLFSQVIFADPGLTTLSATPVLGTVVVS